MEDCSNTNDITLTEKHETKEENVDELNKAMELFGLVNKK